MSKINPLQLERFLIANEYILKHPELLSKRDEVVDYFKQTRNSPFYVDGNEYAGDIFYYDIYLYVKGMNLNEIEFDMISTYATLVLKLDGYYLHS